MRRFIMDVEGWRSDVFFFLFFFLYHRRPSDGEDFSPYSLMWWLSLQSLHSGGASRVELRTWTLYFSSGFSSRANCGPPSVDATWRRQRNSDYRKPNTSSDHFLLDSHFFSFFFCPVPTFRVFPSTWTACRVWSTAVCESCSTQSSATRHWVPCWGNLRCRRPFKDSLSACWLTKPTEESESINPRGQIVIAWFISIQRWHFAAWMWKKSTKRRFLPPAS